MDKIGKSRVFILKIGKTRACLLLLKMIFRLFHFTLHAFHRRRWIQFSRPLPRLQSIESEPFDGHACPVLCRVGGG